MKYNLNYILLHFIFFIPLVLKAQVYEYNHWHDTKQNLNWNWEYNPNIKSWNFSLARFITPRDTQRKNDPLKDIASISDTTGNLLFYTDGDSVYNENGYPLMFGWLSNKDFNPVNSAIFIRKPGQYRYYYLIQEHMPDAIKGNLFSGLSYSVVDRFHVSGKPSMIIKNQPIINSSCLSYKCSYGYNSDTVYLILSVHGKDSVYKHAITSKGISAASRFTSESDTCITNVRLNLPILSSTQNGSIQAFLNYGKGKIVLFPGNGQENNFDALKAYRGAFSPNGRFFYAVHEGTGISKLVQYDLKNYYNDKKIDSVIIYLSVNSLGSSSAMYVGPDQRIYFNDRYSISVIRFPNQKGIKCSFLFEAYKYNFSMSDMKLGFRYGNILPNNKAQKPLIVYSKPLCSFKYADVFLQTGFNDSSYLLMGTEKYFSDSNVFKIKPLLYGSVPVRILYKANDTWLSFADTLSIKESKKFSISGKPLICGNSPSILILKDTSQPFTWSTGQKTSGIVVKNPQRVFLKFSDTSCFYSDTLQVYSVNQKKYIQTGKQVICPGDSVMLNLSTISPKAYFINGSDTMNKISFYKPGSYFLLVNDSGCSFNDSIQIDLHPRHIAISQKKFEVCRDSILSLVSLKNGAVWNWQSNKFITDTFRFKPLDSGYVFLSTVEKCVQKDSIYLSVKKCNENPKGYFLPTAFSPNHNGINEVYYPQIPGMILEKMVIYNRWGQKVYEGNSGWDGILGNSVCTDGVYIVVLKYKNIQSASDDILTLKTTVHLIR